MNTVVLNYTETDSSFLEQNASKVEIDDNEWFYMPFWFKKVGDCKFVIYKFEQLPESVKRYLNGQRDGI